MASRSTTPFGHLGYLHALSRTARAEQPSTRRGSRAHLMREAIREAIRGNQPPRPGASPHELRPTLHACLVISRHQGYSVTISHTYRDRLGMDHHKLLGGGRAGACDDPCMQALTTALSPHSEGAGGSYLRR